MGTSQSKKDTKPGSSLIPPHANQDPEPLEEYTSQKSSDIQNELEDKNEKIIIQPGRLRGFRTLLGRYAATGDKNYSKAALGHWARNSGGVPRVSRAVNSAAALFSALSNASIGINTPAIDFTQLQGLPVSDAIDRLIDIFCPTGILDEELARVAIGQALDDALQGLDSFNISLVNEHVINLSILAFISEVVFISIMGDAGKSLSNAPNQLTAIQRENDVHEITKTVTDITGMEQLQRIRHSGAISTEEMNNVISTIYDEVKEEMKTW